MKQCLICVIAVFLFAGCKQEKAYDDCDTLSEIYADISNDLPGQSYAIYDSLQFFYASINPNNHNEIVYQGGRNPYYYAYTYNLETGQRNKLTELYVTHNLKWHRSNWITFAGEDNNIYIVKPSGDSLIKLTNTSDCFTPEWNGTGDKIICLKGFNNAGNYVINKDGSGISLILTAGEAIGQPCSWSQDDSSIIHAAWQDLSVVNYYSKIGEKIKYNKKIKNAIDGVCWLPNKKQILWCPDSKPEILDIATGNSQALLPFCDKMEYMYPSVTADGKYALFNMNIGGYVGKNTTQIKKRISIIDLTTNTETILDLPE